MVPPEAQCKRLEITNRETAKALFDIKQRTMLAPFFDSSLSISDAAAATGTLPTTMLYFVRRMIDQRVLVSGESETRNGRTVRRFITAAREFYVSADIVDELLIVPERQYQHCFNEAFHYEVLRYHVQIQKVGALVHLLPNGIVQLTGTLSDEDWVPGKNGPIVTFEWSAFSLSDQDAKQLQSDLAALSAKYQKFPTGEKTYYLGLQLAPVPPCHTADRTGPIANRVKEKAK